MTKKSETLLRWLNGAAFALLLVTNALASFLPIAGRKTEEVSVLYPSLFTPASLTFAIWGLIYLLLVGFVVFQAGAFHRERSRLVVQKTGWLFILSCLLNAAWLLSWHNLKLGLSLFCMFSLLFVLLALSSQIKDIGVTFFEKLFTHAAFSIYCGWITVAAIANVTTWLVKAGFSGFGITEEIWMVIVLLLGAVIGCITTLQRRDWVYPLAVIWGFSGIAIRHLSQNDGFGGEYPLVIAAAALGMLALFISGIAAFRRSRLL